MTELLLNGRAIDGIIALVALEAVVLFGLRAWGRGPAAVPYVGNLLSGGFLLLALRSALGGGPPAYIWLCLLASLIAHIVDLFGRWEHSVLKSISSSRPPQMRATLTLHVSKAPVRSATSADDRKRDRDGPG